MQKDDNRPRQQQQQQTDGLGGRLSALAGWLARDLAHTGTIRWVQLSDGKWLDHEPRTSWMRAPISRAPRARSAFHHSKPRPERDRAIHLFVLLFRTKEIEEYRCEATIQSQSILHIVRHV
ncbi:hypothetical protein AND_009598 [Anopheles darlingi]|uniref:Uncharacterized protein n=1 Tax=Anopheles darlingi TaxID=43151 RepID=W5J7P2_ANODA|nr:hypothetical protein AND_009598 [Anopheles darlingi]